MKLLVANNAAPFVRGGAELLADRLVEELSLAGHEAELLRLPLGGTPEQIADSIVAAATMDVVNVDRIIGLKFPAYLLPHSDVVIWLVHQLRQAYEPAPVGWPGDPSLDAVKQTVRRADAAAFAQASRMYSISPVVADRLERYNGVRSEVLMTPPHTRAEFRHGPASGYILAAGRISGSKRQQLAVRAMRCARPGYRLVIAGAGDSVDSVDVVRRQIEIDGVEDRVQLIPRFITEEEKIELFAGCCASYYMPIQEDSYGYVTYEAAMSSKPTITGADSGGTLTLVDDGVSGLVVEPEPEAIARAFDRLVENESEAVAMGRTARSSALALDLSWDRVVRELTR